MAKKEYAVPSPERIGKLAGNQIIQALTIDTEFIEILSEDL